ncbi:class I SAM-dependent methyltransferase [Porticoccaceae bacterium]|nr:class I SAM-dependent methyltransferase [Porticoccaceae bacterium]
MANWDYFKKDRYYSEKLRDRLESGVVMRSANALAQYLIKHAKERPLSIADFGAGPGHYVTAFKELGCNIRRYHGVDFDFDNIKFGNDYFSDDQSIEFSCLDITKDIGIALKGADTVISANTLPHIPCVESFFTQVASANNVRLVVCRMLIGSECIQIKKHLSNTDFSNLFLKDYQHNNVYSLDYLAQFFSSLEWDISVENDIQDWSLKDAAPIAEDVKNEFYSNRVSRSVGDMTFKGDVFMPWRFFIAKRK